ncbi:MAG: methyltransferase domain-containing protein [Candidatus Lokiarchaeota archaeon]|nr:methyltransferase domain-containing protein [Candidatus Lokiarchaeota archaeon]
MPTHKSMKMNHFFELIEDLYEIFVISTGVSLDLFEVIAENKQVTALQIAGIKGYDERMVRAWCDAAVACNYLKQDRDTYILQRWTRSYLIKKSPTQIGFMFENKAIKMMMHPFLTKIKERLEGNHPDFEPEHVLAIPETIKHYAPLIIPIIRQTIPKFTEKCHVLDIGTGIGAYLMNFAETNPNITGVGIDIQDLTIREAQKIAKGKGLDDRLKFIAMDALKLELDEKFDIIFVSNMIQALSFEQAGLLIKKIYPLLKDEGYIVILEILVNDDRISPKLGALTNFYLKMEMLNAGTFSLTDLNSFMKEAGFTNPIMNTQLVSQSYLIYTQK